MSRPDTDGPDPGAPEATHPEPGGPDAAHVLLRLALASPPRLGTTAPRTSPGAGARRPTPTGRLVAVDGPAGSGKTTLAAALAQRARRAGLGVTVVATDDVLRGWDGLAELGPRLRTEVVEPLRAGRDGAYHRYDWHARRTAETVVVPLVDLVVLEGVGSGHPGYDDALSALAWVEAPRDLRRARGLARDGEELAASWDAFVPDEDVLHERERTRERADLLVDGVSGALRVPGGAARLPRGPRSAP